jgi:hypothetical protein
VARYIVYLMLIANVLYLGWNLSGGKSVAQNEQSFPSIPDGVRTLVMLQELAGDRIPVTGRKDSTETDNQAVQQTDNKEGSMADRYEGQEPVREIATLLASTDQPDSHPVYVCKALGPFDEFAAAETVSDRLVSMGLNPMLRSEDSRVVDDYWVYLPGKGRQYSHEVIQQLKAKNINDYYVYDSDDYLISLGTFRRMGHAEKQLAMLQQMGLDAVLEKRYKTRMEYWLEMPVAEKYDVQLDSIAMETSGLEIKTNSCVLLAAR